MHQTAKTTLTLGVLVLVLAGVAVAASSDLDGKAFTVDMGQVGQDKSDPDTLVFADAHFHSTGCDAYGFAPAPYAVERDGDAVRFSAQTTSDTEGRMVWRGTVRGGVVEGTASWHKPGQEPTEYWFKGMLATTEK